MDVSIDKFGRIVIPKPVRDALGLEAGAKLHLETTEGENGEREIALRPEREKPLLVRKGEGNVPSIAEVVPLGASDYRAVHPSAWRAPGW